MIRDKLEDPLEDIEGATAEIKELCKVSDEIVALARLAQTPEGVAFLKLAKKVLAKLDQRTHTKPSRNDQDLRKDIVYQLGGVGVGSLLISLPAAAEAIIRLQPDITERLESVEQSLTGG